MHKRTLPKLITDERILIPLHHSEAVAVGLPPNVSILLASESSFNEWKTLSTLEQMAQSHVFACVISGALNVNLKAPQWQLPWYSTRGAESDMGDFATAKFAREVSVVKALTAVRVRDRAARGAEYLINDS
jgi:hypothetical protein